MILRSKHAECLKIVQFKIGLKAEMWGLSFYKTFSFLWKPASEL